MFSECLYWEFFKLFPYLFQQTNRKYMVKSRNGKHSACLTGIKRGHGCSGGKMRATRAFPKGCSQKEAPKAGGCARRTSADCRWLLLNDAHFLKFTHSHYHTLMSSYNYKTLQNLSFSLQDFTLNIKLEKFQKCRNNPVICYLDFILVVCTYFVFSFLIKK